MGYTEKIKAEVNKFNDNDTNVMTVRIDDSFAALFINSQGVMTGTDIEVFLRIKQINKELGYNYL